MEQTQSLAMGQAEKSEINYGVQLLRMIMCLGVVQTHSWTPDWDNAGLLVEMLWRIRGCSVATFMFISGYYSFKIFADVTSGNMTKVKKRFARIYIPLAFWSVLYFIVYNINDSIKSRGGYTLNTLIIQLLTGSTEINSTLWYLAALFIVTAIIFAVVRFFPKRSNEIFMVLIGLALFMGYSGLNDRFFEYFDGTFIASYAFRKLPGQLPIALVGYLLASTGIVDKIKKEHWLAAMITCIYCLFMLMKFQMITSTLYGVFTGMFFFIAFYMIPFDKMPRCSEFVKRFAVNSMGIYCMHWMTGKFVVKFWKWFSRSYVDSLLIFAISYVILYVVSKFVPDKYGKYIYK